MKKIIIYYFLFLLSIFSLLSSGVIDSQDGFQYLAVARNIYYKGEPTTPPYEYDKRQNIHMSVVLGKDGNTYSLTSLGYSLAYLPAVALTDLAYRFYNVSPPVHFPLENDWLVFLTASFTNSFFASFLGITLFLYLVELGLSKKQALFISLLGLFATNLLVYAKHSFPHMMFVTFLFLSFYLVKMYARTKKNVLLILSGLSFGINSITYNQTYVLALIPLATYFLLLTKFKINLSYAKFLSHKALLFFMGFLPFIYIYFWFERIRATPPTIYITSAAAATNTASWLVKVPKGILLEGLYGQLFSPGRSVFLYSPILILVIIFWHKIKKIMFPEFLVFAGLSIIYILFYSTVYRVGGADQGITGFWHGELSWGPRYLTPLIPFGMLVVGHIYQSLSKRIKLFVLTPLILIGLYVNLLSVIIPYQTKFFNLQEKFFLNGTEYPVAVYSNFLPRYTPLLTMSKNLIKLFQNLPKTLDHGIYNVRFYDGIDLPFNVGPERWRVIEGKGYISFDNSKENPVTDLAFGLINHPLSAASESAKIQFMLNNTPLLEKPYQLKITQRESIKVPTKESLIKPKDNQLIIEVDFGDPTVITKGKQILGLQSLDINGQRQNMESIDVPYVSALGPKMAGVKYQNWGGTNQDLWKLWHIHSQTYERLPDLWWIRNLYYWDIPKTPLLLTFIGVVSISSYFGFKLFSNLNRESK